MRPALLRRSLAAQAVLLTVVVTLSASILVGWIASWRMASRLAAQLEQRGTSMVELLERHKDLHSAVLQRDPESATQILQLIASSDVEVEYVGLLDPRGKLLAAAARDGADPRTAVQAQLAHHPLSTPGLADSDRRTRRFTQAVAADAGEKGIWAGHDEQLYAAGTTIGYLVLGMRDRGTALARGYAAVMVAAVGVALAAAFLLLFLSLARRLRRILRFADRLAERDLTADLPDRSEDEVGRVAGALRAMRDRTREIVAELAAAAAMLQESSAAMHASALVQRERADDQAVRVAEIGASVLELERSSRVARDHAEGVIQGATRHGREADEGRRAVAENAEAVGSLRADVMHTAEALRGLAGHTVRIDEIARTVADLADRTHVLAINTGIEAAHAGEGGRAFRIVADEMRELAAGSRASTDRVRSILSEIARAAVASHAAAAAGNDRAEAAADRARAATQAIDELAAALAGSVETATRIAATSREQASAIEAISVQMADVRRAAEEVAAEVAGLEEASQDVLGRAEQLQRTVGGYRVAAHDGPTGRSRFVTVRHIPVA